MDVVVAGDEACVAVGGRFDAHEVVPFRGQVCEALARAGHPPDLVLDLSRVDFFDSRALIAVLETCRQVESGGGQFRLRCASGAVLAVLDFTGTAAGLHPAA